MVRIVPKNLLIFSRMLRRAQNPWERKLWAYLRARKFFATKFKRQVRIGDYIVDFCSNEKKLIIELDGSQHSEINVRELDILKENYLKQEGYRVLRFWNNELDKSLESVLEKIRQELETQPLSRPLPSSGERG